MIAPTLCRVAFAVSPSSEHELFGELPEMLDKIDAWIGNGVLGGGDGELNAADFMIAPSLAMILYNPDVQEMFRNRPALALVDRLLPEPRTRGIQR